MKRSMLVAERRQLLNAATPHSIFNVRSEDGRVERTFQVPETRRVAAPATVELETRDDAATPVIRGHAAVFDQRSYDLGGFYEVVARGAFRRALDAGAAECRCLFNHDPNMVLASVHNRTLDLREDPKGLHYYAQPIDTTYAADVRALIARGDVFQSSFAFTVERDRWELTEADEVVRTILEVRDLFDVSPVTYPAYPQTDASARSSAAPEGAEEELTPVEGVVASDDASDAAATEARKAELRELQLRSTRRWADLRSVARDQ